MIILSQSTHVRRPIGEDWMSSNVCKENWLNYPPAWVSICVAILKRSTYCYEYKFWIVTAVACVGSFVRTTLQSGIGVDRMRFSFSSSQLEWGHFGRLGSRTRPQRAPDCRERDAELLPVTAHWSPDGPQGLPDWHPPRPGRRRRGGKGGGQGRGVWRWRLA